MMGVTYDGWTTYCLLCGYRPKPDMTPDTPKDVRDAMEPHVRASLPFNIMCKFHLSGGNWEG
jgi:hypothetical protein